MLTHDAENHLVKVKKNNNSIGTLMYDGDGNIQKHHQRCDHRLNWQPHRMGRFFQQPDALLLRRQHPRRHAQEQHRLLSAFRSPRFHQPHHGREWAEPGEAVLPALGRGALHRRDASDEVHLHRAVQQRDRLWTHVLQRPLLRPLNRLTLDKDPRLTS
jgi:YD repeat-containing protein